MVDTSNGSIARALLTQCQKNHERIMDSLEARVARLETKTESMSIRLEGEHVIIESRITSIERTVMGIQNAIKLAMWLIPVLCTIGAVVANVIIASTR